MKQVVPAHKVVGDKGKPGQTVNSTGGVRYLRDVIRKYQEEEKEDRYPERHGTINKTQAIYPPDNAEKRLERLKTALLAYLNKEEEYIRDSDGVYKGQMVSSDEVRKIIEENT